MNTPYHSKQAHAQTVMQKHLKALLYIWLAINTLLLQIAIAETQQPSNQQQHQEALFAGGCFWCIEADFDKLPGVVDVVSGYTGGSKATANYKTVSSKETGHYEAVRVQYDPTIISYRQLVDYFWSHIDPTDANGQFCDRGSSYRAAVFYRNEQQRNTIERSKIELEKTKPFSGDIVTAILPEKPFYLAETYHQNYAKKNPLRYRFYRSRCGRDKRIKSLWKAKGE